MSLSYLTGTSLTTSKAIGDASQPRYKPLSASYSLRQPSPFQVVLPHDIASGLSRASISIARREALRVSAFLSTCRGRGSNPHSPKATGFYVRPLGDQGTSDNQIGPDFAEFREIRHVLFGLHARLKTHIKHTRLDGHPASLPTFTLK
jgi:hypothetical protein